jgi:hypothetical protein
MTIAIGRFKFVDKGPEKNVGPHLKDVTMHLNQLSYEFQD